MRILKQVLLAVIICLALTGCSSAADKKQIKPTANGTTNPKSADGHVLSNILMYKHPNVVTERMEPPLLSLPYTVSGPETYKYKKKDAYQGVQMQVQQPGSYSFKIDVFDLKERPITEEAKNKQ